MKSFKTSVGKEYTFTPPSYEKYDPPTESSLILIDGDGHSMDIFMRPTPSVKGVEGPLSKIPLPTQDKKEEYGLCFKIWYKNYDEIQNSFLLPIPMGVAYRRPSSPHVPTPLEKDRTSVQYRVAKSSFSTKLTPLYPANYIQLHEMIVDGNPITDKFLVEKGPNGQQIPVSNHFSENLPWYAQLIPPRPIPQLFKTYEDFEGAMKNWMMKVNETCEIIPFSPKQLQEIFGLKRQSTYIKNEQSVCSKDSISSTDYFKLISNPVSDDDFSENCVETNSLLTPLDLTEFEMIPPSNALEENAAPRTFSPPKEDLKLLRSVRDLSFQYKNAVKNPPQMSDLEIPDDLQPNKSLYEEWTKFGPYKQLKGKLLAKGTFFNSLYPGPKLKPIESVQVLPYLCDRVREPGARYELYKTIISLLDDKLTRDSIVTDNDNLFAVYNVLYEFSDCIIDMPIIFSDTPNNILITTFFYTLANYYITIQLIKFEESINNAETAQVFRDRLSIQTTTLLDIFTTAGSQILDYIKQNANKYPGFLSQIVFLMMSIGKIAFDAMNNCSFPLISFLLHLSENYPEYFRIIHRNIYFSMEMSSYVVEQLGALFYVPNDLIKCKNPEFISFLCEVLQMRYPRNKFSQDVSWVLLFCTIILSQNSISKIPEMEQKLFYSTIIFVQNRIWADRTLDQWNFIIPNLLTPIFAAIPLQKDESSLLVTLKALRRISNHPAVMEAIKDRVEEFITTLCGFIESHSIKISVSGIRTLKYFLYHHQKLLSIIADNPELLERVGNSLFLRNEESLIEIFKMIMIFTRPSVFSKVKWNLKKILISSHFRIGAAKSTVLNKAHGKLFQKYKTFMYFLSINSSASSFLLSIDKILASRH